MEPREVLSIIAGVLFVIAYVPYVRAIRRGDTKPAKASWLIWATLDTITAIGMYVAGTLNGQIIGAVIGVWVVVLFALKRGTPGWTKFDKFCLVGAILGIVLWQVFSNPVLGIVTSLSVVFIGSIPTFSSAWKDPGREDRTAWTIFWLSCVVAVIAVPQWTLADAAQPVIFLTVETIMMYILYFRSRPQAKVI